MDSNPHPGVPNSPSAESFASVESTESTAADTANYLDVFSAFSDEEDEAPPQNMYVNRTNRISNSPDGKDRNPMGSKAYSDLMHAASAIAKASILDTSASSVSDDEGVERHVPQRQNVRKATALPPILSNPISNFPDEQDRKRVLGCLAAILASLYSYDVEVGNDENDDDVDDVHHLDFDDEKHIAKGTDNPKQETYHRYDSTGSRYNKNGDSGEMNERVSSEEKTQSPTVPKRRPKHSPSMSLRRHRRRRYEIYSKLLQNVCSLLFLDRSQARAFLPMLNALLKPPPPARKPRKKFKPKQPIVKADSSDGNDLICDFPSGSFHSEEGEADNSLTDDLNSCNTEDGDDESICSQTSTTTLDHIEPFLHSLDPKEGFKCISLLLLHHLLLSKEGYDARIRYVFKKLAIIILSHEIDEASDNPDPATNDSLFLRRQLATRKFEALECTIAAKLLAWTEQQTRRAQQVAANSNNTIYRKTITQTIKKLNNSTQFKIIRGLKIGSAAVLAGTLFAVSGGMAAPAIAAGVAAVAGSTAATTAVVLTALTSTTAVTAIFGVGGGSLAAYKMHRRSKGLTEFLFQKETTKKANLFRTVCISGWLSDRFDFQRPWGVIPRFPPISKRELLERFYSVYKKENVERAGKILNHWKGEERKLWDILRQKYGRDPDHLFPIGREATLSNEEDEIVHDLFYEICSYQSQERFEPHRLPRRPKVRQTTEKKEGSGESDPTSPNKMPTPKDLPNTPVTKPTGANNNATIKKFTPWDYQTQYSGELYTVKWESDLILELCDSVTDLAVETVGGVTKEILRHTAIASLITAITLPVAMVTASNVIDETWGLAIQRAEEAGKELAYCLLHSESGNRPVTLIGYSFGARVIYTCLKELVKHQEIWEDMRDKQNSGGENNQDDVVYLREPASIVEDAVLMGTPNHLSISSWKACRRIVAGRFVNCYSRKDWILSYMFQYKRMTGIWKPVCGVAAINIPGVENFDVTDYIVSHSDYCLEVENILRLVGHGRPRERSFGVCVDPEEDGDVGDICQDEVCGRADDVTTY